MGKILDGIREKMECMRKWCCGWLPDGLGAWSGWPTRDDALPRINPIWHQRLAVGRLDQSILRHILIRPVITMTRTGP